MCKAWADYQKAFDRVPQIWIIKSLEIIGINTKVISFTKKVMGYCGQARARAVPSTQFTVRAECLVTHSFEWNGSIVDAC